MKQFSISGVLLSVALVVMGIALVTSQRSNHFRQSENAKLLNEIESYNFIIDRKYDTIQQYRLGASYLVKLSQTEQGRSKFLPFLSRIDRKGFAFVKIELERVEGYSIYNYFEAKRNPDRSERANHSPMSLCLLVNDDTLEILDSMKGSNGLDSVGFSQHYQYLTWENPDGSTTEYRITETGFTQSLTDGEPAE